VENTQVVIVNNPFKHYDREIMTVDDVHGDSLLSFRNRYLPDDINFSIAVNGAVIRPDDWSNYLIKNGDSIVCVPKIEEAASTAVAVWVATLLASAAVAGTVITVGLIAAAYLMAYMVTYMAIMLIGGFLINTLMGALFGPDAPGGGGGGGGGAALANSQAYSWDPNSAQRAGLVVPKVYGTVILHGNIISVHTDNEQNIIGETDSYINTLISLGYGPFHSLYDHKISDQPIANFTNVRIVQRLGYMYQSAIPYFNDTKTEYTMAVDIAHSLVSDGYIYTTIGDSFNGLEVDLTFPYGIYYMTTAGASANHSINIRVDCRRVGDVDWIELTQSTILSSDESLKWDTETRWGLGMLVWADPDSDMAAFFIAHGLVSKIDSSGRVLGRLEVDPDDICLSTGYTRADLTRYNLFSGYYFVPDGEQNQWLFFYKPEGWYDVTANGPSPYTGAVSGLHYNGGYTSVYDWTWTANHVSEESDVILPEKEYESFTSNKRESLKYTLKTQNDLPAGHYEIRVTKCSGDISDIKYGDRVILSSVREVYVDDFSYPREVLIGLNALATGQLSGRFDYSCKVMGALIRVWTGSEWAVSYNNNPAWVCYDIITQPVFNDPDRVVVGDLTFMCMYSHMSTEDNKPGVSSGLIVIPGFPTSSLEVRATTTYSSNYYPFYATDPKKSLTGDWTGNAWISAQGLSTNQRFHIDLGSVKVVNSIYYENGHHLGWYTSSGVKNFILQGSNSASSFANLTFNDDEGWTTLSTSEDHFDRHIESVSPTWQEWVGWTGGVNGDIPDPKYISVNNVEAYRYYALKFIDNYGDVNYMSLRRIQIHDNVRATTRNSDDYWPYYATDITKSLIGSWAGNAWISELGTYTNQRFHIDLGSEKIIDSIYYENGHHLGGYTSSGVKNFILQGSNSALSFLDLTFSEDEGWITLSTSEDHFDRHKGSLGVPDQLAENVSDRKCVYVYGNTAYRYYALKFIDNYGDVNYMSLRRIELKGSTDRWTFYWTLTEPIIGTAQWNSGISYKDMSDAGVDRYEGYDPARIDYASFKTWADWCDVYVYKGEGSGQVVYGRDGKKYGCILSHTATQANGPGYTPGSRHTMEYPPPWFYHWQEITGGTAVTWTVGTEYTVSAERRMVFNGTFDVEFSLWDAASRVAASARASLIWNGYDVSVVVDKSETASQLFSQGNIIVDSFEETFLPMEDRVSEIEITFINEEKNYEKDICSIYNPNMTSVSNKTTLTSVGTTSPSQAWRMGEYLLLCNQYLKRTIKFDADVDAIACTIGDVINFQHDVPRWGLAGGRLVYATINTITLDQEVTVAIGTYTVMIRISAIDDSGKDLLVTKDVIITAPMTTDNFTVSSNFSVIPSVYDVYAFGEHDIQVKPFRVISIEHKQDQTFTIRAVEYVEAIYAVDTGDAIRPAVIEYTEAEYLLPVTSLVLEENNYFDPSGIFINAVQVSFIKPSGYKYRKAIIRYKVKSLGPTPLPDSSGSWVTAGETDGDSFLIQGLNGLTTYQVMVISVSQIGELLALSQCPLEVITTTKSYGINEFTIMNVGSLQIFGQGNVDTFEGRDCKFVWNPMAVSNTESAAGYEIDGAGSALPAVWFKDYEVKVYSTTGILRRTEYTTEIFYTYTFEKNSEDSGGAKSSFKITVSGRDRLGRISPSPTSLIVTNTNPDNVGVITAVSVVGGVNFSWPKNDDTDFGTYIYMKRVSSESWPVVWTDVADNKVTCSLTAAQITTYGNKASISIRVKVKDVFGNVSDIATESAAFSNYVSDSLFQLVAYTTGSGDVSTLYDGNLSSGGVTI
jgi:hypothetical protein